MSGPAVGRSDVVDADVIVVGGGSSGSVVASRLSENPDCRVVVVEAGQGVSRVQDYPPDIADAHVLPVGPGSPWTSSYPAELAPGVEREISRGRVLGGSGAVNGAYFIRARPDDFLHWPSRWSYENVLPYFTASETDHDYASDRHGSSGPIPVWRTAPKEWSGVTAAFVDASESLGFPADPDKNDPSPVGGTGPVPLNVFRGMRMNAAATYLIPRLSRPNLEVLTESTVLKILFDGDAACGVRILRRGVTTDMRASRVVLCAGAVRTPQLLMLSGVGPAESLRHCGIDVRLDHPRVGRGFSDHPEIGVYYRSSVPFRPSSPIEVVLHVGDLEIRPYTASFGYMIAGIGPVDPMIGIGLMRADSRGDITLRSADPLDSPFVRYRYLDSAADRAALHAGLDVVDALLSTAPMTAVATKLEVAGDRLLGRLGTALHLSGSCAMGGPDAVLDDRCRVRGVYGLDVVDTSSFPVVPTRGPHATVIMLAERAARDIADDLG
ncbi:mycofactocin system GMC family oxidoreductase MftG [Rhodococcus sp. BP-252]|uniref:GMC oxidoreductase n=1 Tax=Rhodococcoides kyotonense TaxID=398843 RepID=A0A177Y768_9NOCA|nr:MULTISPECIES: mycofactocin system GMC family oxidoreductase MftG [Rhodococcus]MBY6410466.1 mycofactocin system GMC family oxidoreductase MftG [Rhodococcus sp. BP-320]MBY6416348.1 mycofactocin system GMC family oxidoreductase MftG [Rhodococcus sp. BP-321]MBY6420343.1 mycofactocin system GMC family oxidoreductase MftG [Rhodococcus sp. BP-324]MBY6425022.1 mycofactocin system GMC family oxidoreductase MftG [Rhodococcus sp. BP-323]MBY6430272.1 mycofactocin system GMC family oxidoreductase MftG [